MNPWQIVWVHLARHMNYYRVPNESFAVIMTELEQRCLKPCPFGARLNALTCHFPVGCLGSSDFMTFLCLVCSYVQFSFSSWIFAELFPNFLGFNRIPSFFGIISECQTCDYARQKPFILHNFLSPNWIYFCLFLCLS